MLIRIILLVLVSHFCLGQTTINAKKGLAVEGYDVVSYFNGEPKEGKESYQSQHQGITYYFNSEKNLEAFKKSPDKYIPAYGGWCAYAMGETGEKVKIDPETYKILDGKLYLFYNFWGNNTLEPWNENEKKLKSQADKNWDKLKNN
ncbi:YHS domain-containing (seleno)protein [Fulvivirga lutea]|uniref:YHS domain-containing protein n=1 Tax=Fulvivirga lutea TaxID=2810512 RepID=A0A974WHF5_9BACT|nr:YHS domain-containing (seleno)protein [Fulvivirga lutea]QSE98593.1 YHS domain-containing protein [Fulvivirga lutea]